MMSKGSKSQDVQGSVSIALNREALVLLLDQTATTLRVLSMAWDECSILKYQLEALLGVRQGSQAKPSKKRPRTAKPRTSTLPKA